MLSRVVVKHYLARYVNVNVIVSSSSPTTAHYLFLICIQSLIRNLPARTRTFFNPRYELLPLALSRSHLRGVVEGVPRSGLAKQPGNALGLIEVSGAAGRSVLTIL